jgi:PKD repeat protein
MICLLTFLFSEYIRAQSTTLNLVPNPGFETYTYCPLYIAQPTAQTVQFAPPWGQAGGSPDYMRLDCPFSQLSFYFSARLPHSGKGSMGLWAAAGSSTYREYIQAPLLCPLQPGISYVCSMWMAVRNNAAYLTDGPMGAYFSSIAPSVPLGAPISASPQVSISTTHTGITYNFGWTQMIGTFTATDTNKFITIGNFGADSISIAVVPGASVYYNIDDITVTPIFPNFSATPGCAGEISQFANLTVDPNNMGGNYVWDFGDGTKIAAIKNPVHTYATRGTYKVTLSVKLNKLIGGSCISPIDSIVSTTIDVTVGSKNGLQLRNNFSMCKGDTTSLIASGYTSYTWSPDLRLDHTYREDSVVLFPTTTTTYTVIGADGACADTATTTISIPVISNAGNDAYLCSGDSLMLQGSGAGTYSWVPSVGLSDTGIANPIAKPSVTTTYQLTVSNGSCTDTDSVTITVKPPIYADAGHDVYLCPGQLSKLNCSGGGTNTWIPALGLSYSTIAKQI